MNRLCYKVIFSKHLNQLVVVPESAMGATKSGSSTSAVRSSVIRISRPSCLKSLIAGLLFGLGLVFMSTAYANPTTVIADKQADKSLQPVILNTANGLTQVNIQTPNAKGLSNNHYSQFDVGSQGLILNNARKDTPTELAGFVAANPYLARGEATTILNQINSTNPSKLNGFVEVAGKKADVIIANPQGLSINGLGFINAGSVHLSAGKPLLEQGKLSGYQTQGGHIAIDGKLNATQTDYTALIGQSIKINDAIYAKELDVVTIDGTSKLDNQGRRIDLAIVAVPTANSASSSTTTTNPSTNQTPTGVVLDVASLGGMYAGQIRLIGTSKGLGVTNAGTLYATDTLQLDNQGNLINTGTLASDGKLSLATKNINNQGTISSQSDINLTTDSLTNQGLIHNTQTLQLTATNTLNNSGTMNAGVISTKTKTLTNTGGIQQTGLGSLAISTQNLNNKDHAVIGQNLYTTTASNNPNTSTNSGSTTTPSTNPLNKAPSTAHSSFSTQSLPTTAIPAQNGSIKATDALNNIGQKAQIIANGNITAKATQTQNTNKASMALNSLDTQSLANTDSRLQLDSVDWTLTTFDNSQGQLSTKQSLNINSQSQITNHQGTLSAGSNLNLSAKDQLDNRQGNITSLGATTITASTADNTQGNIHGTKALDLSVAGDLTNQQGGITSLGGTNIQSFVLNNTEGNIYSKDKLTVQSTALTNSGQLYSHADSHIQSQNLTNTNQGIIASLGTQTIKAHTLNSAGILASGMTDTGNLSDKPTNLTITTQDRLTSTGTALATGALTLQGSELKLTGSQNQGQDITLTSQGNISTSNARVVSANTLNITAPTSLNNQGGRMSANTLTVQTDKLDNQKGTIEHIGQTALSLAIKQSINNSQGVITSGGNTLNLSTNSLINTKGSIEHTGQDALSIQANSLDNQQGKILSATTQHWHITQDINNQQGAVQASALNIQSKSLNNTDGNLLATNPAQHSTLTLNGDLLNQGKGVIATHGDLNITAKTLDNQGSLQATALSTDSSTLNNQGTISANKQLTLSTKDQLTNQGVIAGGNDVKLSSGTAITHQGKLIATDNLSLTAPSLDLTGSSSQAKNITLTAQDDIHHNHATSYAVGQFSATTPNQISNNQGTISAKDITITTHQLNNGGIIQADDSLTLSQTADYIHTNQDKLFAKQLTLSTQGTFTNQSTLSANRDLSVSAHAIHNKTGAALNSGGTTALQSQTRLTNQGLINGEKTYVKTATLDNSAGGRIYGSHLAIQANTLNNTPVKSSPSDSQYTSPVIGARDRLDLGVGTLNNNPNPDRAGKFNQDFENQALITSLGSLHIGGTLDKNHQATGKAQAVINRGATIEAGIYLNVLAGVIKNENADFASHFEQVGEAKQISEFSTGHVVEGSYTDRTKPVYISIGGWDDHWHKILITPTVHTDNYTRNTYTKTQFTPKTTYSDPALIRAGQDASFVFDEAINKDSFVAIGNLLSLSDDSGNPAKYGFSNQASSEYAYHSKTDGMIVSYHTYGKKPAIHQSRRPFTAEHRNSYPDINIKETLVRLPILNAPITTTPNQPLIGKIDPTNKETQDLLNTLKANQSALSANAQQQLAELLSAKDKGQVIDTAVLDSLIDSFNQSIDAKQTAVITTQVNTQTIPTSNLYIINTDVVNKPLIETDPAFTNHKNWLSSEYMLKALSGNQDNTHKRLGDGYYEQKLLQDQYHLLTGRHLLSNHQDSQTAYQALMDQGITQAKSFDFKVGIALSPEQMAQLTTDMVWLVKSPVTYHKKDQNGHVISVTEEVLVPKLYLRSNQNTGTLTADGRYSSITGKNINLQLTGKLDNQGNLIATDALTAKAQDISNQGVLKGDFVQIQAANNLTNQNTIHADSALSLTAGNDVINQSQSYHTQSSSGLSLAERTGINRIASVSVGDKLKGLTDEQGKPLNTLNIKAGNYVRYVAGQSDNQGGSTLIQAGGNIELGAITTTNRIHAISSDKNYVKQSQSENVGSSITSLDDTQLIADGKVYGTATQIHSAGNTVVEAQDLIFNHGQSVNQTQTATQHSEKKWYGSKKVDNASDYYSDTAVLGAITGKNVQLTATTGNATLLGTQVVANSQATIQADKGDITLQSAVNTTQKASSTSTQNFYKATDNAKGALKQTLAQTGISAGSIDIQGKSVNLNAVNLAAEDGNIMVGNARLDTNNDGSLKLDESGKPIVLSGDMQNLNIGTITLQDEQYDQSAKRYRGAVKSAMQVASVGLNATGIDSKITLARTNTEHSQTQTEIASILQGDNIAIGANNVLAQGTIFTTNAGTTQILGKDVTLGTATQTKTTNTSAKEQTVEAENLKLGRDHIQLAALILTDEANTTTTKTTQHQGASINSKDAILLGDMNSGSVTTKATKFNLDGETGSLLVGSKDTLLDGAIDEQSTAKHTDREVTRIGASVHHVAVDAVVAAENLKEAVEAVNQARRDLQDAKDRIADGRLEASALKDYEAGLAIAMLNVANAKIALAATLATAGNTSATMGFSAKVGASHTQSTDTTAQTQQDYQGTSIHAASSTLVGEDLTAKGLQGNIGQLNVDNLNRLTLTHGMTSNSQSSEGRSKTIEAGVSTSGAVTAGLAQSTYRSRAGQTVAHDTSLTVGELSGYAKHTTLSGAQIVAGGGDYATNNLTIITSQNQSNSQSRSLGGNVGVSTQGTSLAGASAGYHQSQSQAQGATNNTPSGIIYVNTDGKHSLRAEHTELTGGIIAAISQDEQGNQTNDKLNFTTKTLTSQDLLATEHSQHKGFGINVGLTSKQGDTDLSSIGIQANRQGHDKQTLSLATIGQGATVIDTITHNNQTQTSTDISQTDINTNANAANKVIKDTHTGGLNINTTLDTRVFTKAGRQEIKKEQEELPTNTKAAFGMFGIAAGATAVGLLDDNENSDRSGFQKAKDNLIQARNNVVTGADRSQANLNAHIDAITEGDLTDALQNQDILNELNAQLTQGTTAKDTSVYLTQGTVNNQGQEVKGQANTTKGHTYLNINHIDTTVETLNHEIAHHNDLGETSATAMGKLGNFAYNIGTSLNADDINTHRQTITPTAKTLQNLSPEEQLAIKQDNQALLNANEVQRAWEVESGDGVWDQPGVSQGKWRAQQKDCRKAGVSSSDCSAYIHARSVSRAKNIASVLVPTSPEEVAFIVVTAGGGYVLKVAGKAGVKVVQSFRSKKELDEAVAEAKKISQTNTTSIKASQKQATQTKTTCTNGTVCFTAGTLIETSEGLKPIETFTGGELIWSRNDITLEYGYHPVIATKATPDQPIFQVTVKNNQGDIETLETTAEHPFWIKETGWLKASLLEQGMILLDRNNQEVEVLSQYLIPNHTDTVYNIEVDHFHTYHVGRLGVWVHNDECCGVLSDIDRWSEIRQSVKPPHPRHKIDQIAKTQAKTKNTVVSSKVDMNKDIELIRQGLGTPKRGSSGEMQIEINGRTYQKHAGGGAVESDRLIPISSNAKGEIFELSRGEYINLQEIVRNGGDIAKSKAQMSRRKDFNQKDFDKAVEVYNETR